MLLPLRPLSVDGDLERPLEVSLLRPPLNNKLTKVLERCRVLFSSGSFPFCFFSFFCLISVIGQRTISHRFHFNWAVVPWPGSLPASPSTVTWLWDLLMGRLGLLRASSTAVFGFSLLPPASSARITVSLSRVVRPRLRVVSVPVLWEGRSVWMAVSVRSDSDLNKQNTLIMSCQVFQSPQQFTHRSRWPTCPSIPTTHHR